MEKITKTWFLKNYYAKKWTEMSSDGTIVLSDLMKATWFDIEDLFEYKFKMQIPLKKRSLINLVSKPINPLNPINPVSKPVPS